MSTPPQRRPSTLAASKFVTSRMPLGATPDPRTTRPAPAPTTGAGRPLAHAHTNANANAKSAGIGNTSTWGQVHGRTQNTSQSASLSATAPSKAPAKPAARGKATGMPGKTRNRQDHIVVTSLVVAFVLLTLGIGSMRVQGGMSTDRSKTAVSSTLSVVHEQQTAFRTRNQRFATWTELADRGMTLGPRQVVVRSNATASHWFMAIRDSSTGVVCSRTGELFDEGPYDRQAACSGSAL